MLENFYPDLLIDKVQNINLGILKEKNIKGLILDIDNTLVPQHMKEADKNAVSWIEHVRKAGMKACIVSNASKKRVIKFNERLKLSAIHRASKPGTKSYLKAAKLMELNVGEIAVVGDQVFTDVYGGNKIGMFTILVKPIDKKEILFIKLKRIAEKLVLSSYDRRTKRIGMKKTILIKKYK
jgi:uncharacterized protein